MQPPPAATGRRRRLGRALAEMHFQLRTQGGTPARKALAVFVGTLVGCTPLLGLHLLLCAVAARLARLNPVRTYLAAHINNPLTAPFLIYGEWAVGHRLLEGAWPALSLAEFQAAGWSGIGGSLVLGSLTVGLVLGGTLGLSAYVISARSRRSPLRTRLVEAASRRYVPAGSFTWELVRARLRLDPVRLRLLEAGLLPPHGLLVEVGCGRGVLLALVAAARELHREGHWSDELPPPPGELRLAGVERRERRASAARIALGEEALIEVADPVSWSPPACDGLVLLDLLQTLPAPEQERLLAQAARALRPNGVLVIREADAAAGLRFLLHRLLRALRPPRRGDRRSAGSERGAGGWRALLEGAGLSVRSEPARGWLAPAGVLLVGRRAC